MSLIRARYRAVNTIMNLPRGGYVGLLDLFPNAAAAYSLRKLRAAYSGAAVRVRRSSDNTEQDIAFDANGNLDTSSLLSFVNEDVIQYTSDFSSTEDLSELNGTGAAAQSIGGVDDAYKFTLSGGSALHQSQKATNSNGGNFSEEVGTLTFDYYLPSGQTMDEVFVGFTSGTALGQTTTDAWTSVSLSITAFGGGTLFFRGRSGGSQTFAADGDVFYLKNIVVTQTSADGLVTVWYDQSLSNNATQTTAANQPKIVSAGSLVTENGKAAITSDTEWLSGPISLGEITAFSLFVVGKNKNTTTTNAPLVALNSDGYSAGDRWIAIRKLGTSMQFPVSDGSSTSTKTFSSLNANQNLYSGFYVEGGLQNTSQNGVLIESSNTLSGVDINSTVDFFTFNNAGSIVSNNGGGLQEVIVYPSNQSANRIGIEGSINEYYNIY